MSDFDEKAGIIPCPTDWGHWYQTFTEIVIQVDNLPPGTKSKQIAVKIKPSNISCSVHGQLKFEGKLYETVMEDDSTWTIEDGDKLRIYLTKASTLSDSIWKALLKNSDGELIYAPEKEVLHEMTKKHDLEQFQKQYPGMNFSNAKLDKKFEDRELNKLA